MPLLLKTRRFGYDGKGQAWVRSRDDVAAAWAAIGERPAVAEQAMHFDDEFSVIVARTAAGDVRAWPVSRNIHDGGILRRSEIPPGPAIAAQTDEAIGIATMLAGRLDHVGVMTVEFFACADGPVVNEIAPRVHNSGHWTIEGAKTSQFEQHIRAICGLPLRDTALVAATIGMDISSAATSRSGARWSPTRARTSISTTRARRGPGARWATSRAWGDLKSSPAKAGEELNYRGWMTSIGRPSFASCGRTLAASPTTTHTKPSRRERRTQGGVEARAGQRAIAIGEQLVIIVGAAVERVGLHRPEHRCRGFELAGQLADVARHRAGQLLVVDALVRQERFDLPLSARIESPVRSAWTGALIV